MRKTTLIVILYSLAVLVGGLLGYIRSKSVPSLISGSVFGLLLLLATFFMQKKKNWGYWMAFSLSLMLLGIFTWRFAKSLHFVPAGLLGFLTLFVVTVQAFTLRKQRIS